MKAAYLLTAVAVLVPVSAAHAQDDSLRAIRTLVEESRVDRASLPQNIFSGSGANRQLGVRCATRTPSREERDLIDVLLQPYLRQLRARTVRRVTTIPVVFHVVTKKNGQYDVDADQIHQQIVVLNDSFADGDVVFELSEIRRYTDNGFAKKCLKPAKEKKFKNNHAVDPAGTLNIYTCRPTQGVLGYATFPSDHHESNRRHGVVLLYSTLPGGQEAPFNLGDTAVHEVGHWLELYHTFEESRQGCNGTGDLVDDTPAERDPAEGCPVGRDTCPSHPGADPIFNFMDYSDDSCMDEFTSGQAERAQAEMLAFKPTLFGI